MKNDKEQLAYIGSLTNEEVCKAAYSDTIKLLM